MQRSSWRRWNAPSGGTSESTASAARRGGDLIPGLQALDLGGRDALNRLELQMETVPKRVPFSVHMLCPPGYVGGGSVHVTQDAVERGLRPPTKEGLVMVAPGPTRLLFDHSIAPDALTCNLHEKTIEHVQVAQQGVPTVFKAKLELLARYRDGGSEEYRVSGCGSRTGTSGWS